MASGRYSLLTEYRNSKGCKLCLGKRSSTLPQNRFSKPNTSAPEHLSQFSGQPAFAAYAADQYDVGQGEPRSAQRFAWGLGDVL